MVEMDRRRARIVRAGEGADDSLTQVGAVQALVAHKMFDVFDHRPLEEQLPGLGVAGDLALELGARWGLADPKIAVACGP